MANEKPWAKGLLIVPMLVLNIGLGFFMFTTLRQFVLLFAAWLLYDGRMTDGDMVRARYLHNTIDGVTVILVGLLALIALPLLEHGYQQAVKGNRLGRRFLFVIAVQLTFISAVQMLSWLIFGGWQLASMANMVTVAQLFLGLSLLWLVQRQASE